MSTFDYFMVMPRVVMAHGEVVRLHREVATLDAAVQIHVPRRLEKRS